jgi:acyl-CoA thioester hydrolase
VPREFRWSTPVWQADLDPFGELRTSALLRFLQETATRASTDAGFDPGYYERTQRMWLVRRSVLALDRPVRYGQDIEARTWIADFRRVRSQREYEVRAAGRLVARAHTDWVFVDSVLGQPRRIPAEMEAVFVPEGGAPVERRPFPDGASPANAYRAERRVELHELDAFRHVNNANYVHYVEQGVLDATTAVGWPLARQIESGGRLRTTTHDLEYLNAALLGDILTITIWPTAVERNGLTLATSIGRAHESRPLLRAASRYQWIAVEDGTTRDLPGALRAALVCPAT